MSYNNFEELKSDVKKWHNGYLVCAISNFEIFEDKIISAIKNNDAKTIIEEMASLTAIYNYATSIKYTKEMANVVTISIQAMAMDFTVAKLEIEDYFCKNFITGDFAITEEVLNKHYDMVDWDAYWNASSSNFIKGCREANKLVGYTKDAEMTEYYREDADRYHFKDINYSSYNGGRVIASFEQCEDAMAWNIYGDANQESDGLWWSEQASY